MNCTWEIKEQAPLDAQYLLSYKIQNTNEEKHCTFYSKSGWKNTACHVQKFEFDLFNDITICVAESSHHLRNLYCINITAVSHYKASPPIDITVKESEVEWKPPAGKHPVKDFFYQIHITDWSNNVEKIKSVDLTRWSIENRLKSYSVKVRARINNRFSSSVWSDWSQSVNIEPEQKDYTFLKFLIVTAVTFGTLVLLLMFICRRYKLLENLCQPIPDPKKKFKDLFDCHNGNFQEWINTNPSMTKVPEECIAVTVED
ncbi:interleukin-5 receptor subunit alpha-like isoform X2 [Heterodontus francisci]